jgi:hypothetical protein
LHHRRQLGFSTLNKRTEQKENQKQMNTLKPRVYHTQQQTAKSSNGHRYPDVSVEGDAWWQGISPKGPVPYESLMGKPYSNIRWGKTWGHTDIQIYKYTDMDTYATAFCTSISKCIGLLCGPTCFSDLLGPMPKKQANAWLLQGKTK